MVMVVYGFASQRHALQFEWAWQHPDTSHLCKPIFEQWSKRGLRAADAQVKLAAEMLSLKPFCMYPLTVQVLSVKFAGLWKDTRPLPPHMNIRYAPLKDVPITVPLTFVDEPDDSSSADGDSSCSLSVTAHEEDSAATSSRVLEAQALSGAPGRSAPGDPRAEVCTHAVDLCDSSDRSDGSGEDTESDAEMRMGLVAHSTAGSDAAALPDPDGMYARATRGNLVEKSPGKCVDCAKKLDKNWFRCPGCARLAHDECWAQYLRTSADGQPLPESTILPENGKCPDCSCELTWLQVISEDMSVMPPRNRRRKPKPKKRRPKKGKAAAEKEAASATSSQQPTALGGSAAAPAASAKKKPAAKKAAPAKKSATAEKSAAAKATGTSRKGAAAGKTSTGAGRAKKAAPHAAADAAEARARAARPTHGSRAVLAAAHAVPAEQRRTTAAMSTMPAVDMPRSHTPPAAEPISLAAAIDAAQRRQASAAQRVWAWSPDLAQSAQGAAVSAGANGNATEKGDESMQMHAQHARDAENVDRNVWGRSGIAGRDGGAKAVAIDVSSDSSQGGDECNVGDVAMLTQPSECRQAGAEQGAAWRAGGTLGSALGGQGATGIWEALVTAPDTQHNIGRGGGAGAEDGDGGRDGAVSRSPREALALCDEISIGDGMPPLAVEAGGETFMLRGHRAVSPAAGRRSGGSSQRRGPAAGATPSHFGSSATGVASGALAAGMRRCSLSTAAHASPAHAHDSGAAAAPSHLPPGAECMNTRGAGRGDFPRGEEGAGDADWWPMAGPESPWQLPSELSDGNAAPECMHDAAALLPSTPAWNSNSPRCSPVPATSGPGAWCSGAGAAAAPPCASPAPPTEAAASPVFHSTHSAQRRNASGTSPNQRLAAAPPSPAATPAADVAANGDTCMQNTTPAAARPRRRPRRQLLPMFSPEPCPRDTGGDHPAPSSPPLLVHDADDPSRTLPAARPGPGQDDQHMYEGDSGRLQSADSPQLQYARLDGPYGGALDGAWGGDELEAMPRDQVRVERGHREPQHGAVGTPDLFGREGGADGEVMEGGSSEDDGDVEMVTPQPPAGSPMVIDLMS